MSKQFSRPQSPIKQAGTTTPAPEQPLLFGKSNYTLFAVSVLLVAVGFILMSGTEDIYSNTKIVIAPLVVLAGFGLGFYSILKKSDAPAS